MPAVVTKSCQEQIGCSVTPEIHGITLWPPPCSESNGILFRVRSKTGLGVAGRQEPSRELPGRIVGQDSAAIRETKAREL